VNYRERILDLDAVIAKADKSIAEGRESWKKIGAEVAALEAESQKIADQLTAKRGEAKAHRQATNAEVARRDQNAANRRMLIETVDAKLGSIAVPIVAEEAAALLPKAYPLPAQADEAVKKAAILIPAGQIAKVKGKTAEAILTDSGKTIDWNTLEAK
jgi:hypothetical protein